MRKIILLLLLTLLVSCSNENTNVSSVENNSANADNKNNVINEVSAEPIKYTDKDGNFVGVSHVINSISLNGRKETVVSINENVSNQYYDFTIKDYKLVDTFKNNIGEEMVPEDGYSFLVLNVAIKNNTERTKLLFKEPMGAKVQEINAYIFNGDEFYLCETDMGLANSGLKSGETVEGNVVFIVEKNYKDNPINCVLFVTDEDIYTLEFK